MGRRATGQRRVQRWRSFRRTLFLVHVVLLVPLACRTGPPRTTKEVRVVEGRAIGIKARAMAVKRLAEGAREKATGADRATLATAHQQASDAWGYAVDAQNLVEVDLGKARMLVRKAEAELKAAETAAVAVEIKQRRPTKQAPAPDPVPLSEPKTPPTPPAPAPSPGREVADSEDCASEDHKPAKDSSAKRVLVIHPTRRLKSAWHNKTVTKAEEKKVLGLLGQSATADIPTCDGDVKPSVTRWDGTFTTPGASESLYSLSWSWCRGRFNEERFLVVSQDTVVIALELARPPTAALDIDDDGVLELVLTGNGFGQGMSVQTASVVRLKPDGLVVLKDFGEVGSSPCEGGGMGPPLESVSSTVHALVRPGEPLRFEVERTARRCKQSTDKGPLFFDACDVCGVKSGACTEACKKGNTSACRHMCSRQDHEPSCEVACGKGDKGACRSACDMGSTTACRAGCRLGADDSCGSLCSTSMKPCEALCNAGVVGGCRFMCEVNDDHDSCGSLCKRGGECSRLHELAKATFDAAKDSREAAKAIPFLKLACSRKHAASCLLMGHAYADGKGLTASATLAAKSIQKACKLGSTQACKERLSCEHVAPDEDGRHVNWDMRKCDQLCLQGLPGACRAVANMNERCGGGAESDFDPSARACRKRAETYWKKACDLGDAESCD